MKKDIKDIKDINKIRISDYTTRNVSALEALRRFHLFSKMSIENLLADENRIYYPEVANLQNTREEDKEIEQNGPGLNT